METLYLMAKDKESFLMYRDIIHTVSHLTDDQAGKLFKTVLSYVNDENPVIDDPIVKIAFEPIKQSLKRDLKKYEAIRERNRKNGSKGGRPKNEEPKETEKTQSVNEEPKKADSDSGLDSVIVLGSEFVIESKYSKEVVNFFNEIIKDFPDKTLPKSISQVNKWLDTIEKANRLDGYSFAEIAFVVKWARKDEFWSSNFLSILKLRKTNKEGVKYIDVFAEKCKPKTGSKVVVEKDDNPETWFGAKC